MRGIVVAVALMMAGCVAAPPARFVPPARAVDTTPIKPEPPKSKKQIAVEAAAFNKDWERRFGGTRPAVGTPAFDKWWREDNARSVSRDRLAVENCEYQASQVGMATPGILTSLVNELVTRKRCVEFYQRNGVLPGEMR